MFWHRLISSVRNLEFLTLYQERDIRLIRFSRSWLSREMRVAGNCALSDNTGIPKCAADRLKVFDKIMAKAKEYGIAPDRIHIDPLVEMLCTSEDGIATNIETITSVREQYPTILLRQQSVIFPLICRFVS